MELKESMRGQGEYLFRHRSYLPLLLIPLVLLAIQSVRPEMLSTFWHEARDLAALAVCLAGVLVRCVTVGFVPQRTSGRNTSKQVASTLNTTGMYSLVRHPLYFGNYLILLGFTLFFESIWLTGMCSLAFWLYYERIMLAEEDFLRSRFGEDFTDWASRTPAFLPKLSGWRAPTLPFSLRTVLRREYSGFLLIFVVMNLFELAEHAWIERRAYVDPEWLILLAFAAVVFVVLRTLKKHTHVLHVAGR